MSARPAFLGFLLLAMVLTSAIALELESATAPEADETGIVPIRHRPNVQPRATTEDPRDHTDDWLATALARPLFSRDRRPTPAEAKAGATLALLPRLTGVVIGPFGRSAIFAGTDGGKPTVVTVGKTLGEYKVEKIEPGVVTISGPQGVRQVALAADANARREMTAETRRPSPAQAQVQTSGQVPGMPDIPGQPPGGGNQGVRAALENLRNNAHIQGEPPGSQSPQDLPQKVSNTP